MPKIGIIAAMRREIWPLVRTWKRRELPHAGRSFELYESDLAYAIVAGIGAEPAQLATEALLQEFGLEVLISAGFAGALVEGMRIGGPFSAKEVVDAATGEIFPTLLPAGAGALVTVGGVVREQQKRELAARFGAKAVDMEAAVVARIAQKHGIGFLAVKAITETLEFPMPPVERFVDRNGYFQTARFVGHTAVRPWIWANVARLAAGNRRAARTVSGVLDALICTDDLRKLNRSEATLKHR